MRNKEKHLEYKRYQKRQKVWTKKFIKGAKDFAPWDFSFMWNSIKDMLACMEEYYRYGDNVWAEESPGHNRQAELKKCLEMFEILGSDRLYDEATNFSCKHCKIETNNGKSEWQWDSQENADIFLQMTKEAYQKEQALTKELFVYIAENMQGWWD